MPEVKTGLSPIILTAVLCGYLSAMLAALAVLLGASGWYFLWTFAMLFLCSRVIVQSRQAASKK